MLAGLGNLDSSLYMLFIVFFTHVGMGHSDDLCENFLVYKKKLIYYYFEILQAKICN